MYQSLCIVHSIVSHFAAQFLCHQKLFIHLLYNQTTFQIKRLDVLLQHFILQEFQIKMLNLHFQHFILQDCDNLQVDKYFQHFVIQKADTLCGTKASQREKFPRVSAASLSRADCKTLYSAPSLNIVYRCS